MRLRFALIAAIAALVAAAPACAETKTAFWAGGQFVGGAVDPTKAPAESYWAPRDTSAYTPELWRALERDHVPLFLGIFYKRDFGPVPEGMPHRSDGLAIAREAQRRHIPVTAWLNVPYTDGLWANEHNAREMQDSIRWLARWKRRHHIRLAGAVLDVEPSIEDTKLLFEALRDDRTKLPDFVAKAVDPRAHCQAVAEYDDLVQIAWRNHIGVSMATYPMALDDSADSLGALQDALDIAALPPRGWSAGDFFAYRSLFHDLLGQDPGPGIVASYWQSAQQQMGARAG